MPHFRCLTVVALLTIAAANPPHVSAERPAMLIGMHGSGFTVSDSWQRRKFSSDFGRDQFVLHRGGEGLGFYLIIAEYEGLLETEQDYRTAMRDCLAGTSIADARQQPIRFERRQGVGHASVSATANIGGLKAAYSIRILGFGALRYHVVAWTGRSEAMQLDAAVNRVVSGFQFPQPNSPWARGLEPRTAKVTVEGHVLEFKHRPGVLLETPFDVGLKSVVSDDGDHAAYIMLTAPAESCDDSLDNALAAINDGESNPFVEKSRRDFEVDGVAGRMMLSHDGQQAGYLFTAPLPSGEYLDVRYVHRGRLNEPRFDRKLFFDSLSLKPIDLGFELPALTNDIPEIKRNARQKRIADASRLVATTDAWSLNSAHWLGDGRVLTATGRQVTLHDGGSSTVLYESDEWRDSLEVHAWRGGWWTLNADGELVNCETGEPAEIEVRAERLAIVGDDILFVPKTKLQTLVGIDADISLASKKLMRLTPGGKPTQVAEFPPGAIERWAFDAAATRVAVGIASLPATRQPSFPSSIQLFEFDLATGEQRSLGGWASLSHLAPGPGGLWLATGRRLWKPIGPLFSKSLPVGVCLVRSADSGEIILTSEDALGVAIDGRDLIYTTAHVTPDGQRQAVFRITQSDVEKDGLRCRPFSVDAINRVADAWAERILAGGEELHALTVDEISSLCGLASEVSRESSRFDWPDDAVSVDQLFEVVQRDSRLSLEGKILLSMTLTHNLIGQGAEWAPGSSAGVVDWVAADTRELRTAYAVGYTPAGLLTSTLYDGEGMWDPATTLVENADGRRIILGLTSQAVEQAVADAAIDGVDQALADADAIRLIELLERAPENLALRELVYERLAAAGEHAAIVATAAPFATRDSADPRDARAWLAARELLSETPDSRQQLKVELIDAVRQHPHEATLYLLLGKVLEDTDAANPQRAIVCYNRALEISSWGQVGDIARERLEALQAD